MASENKPTLHHMNNSQSQRILWLLEELQIPYNLDLYSRQPTGPERGRAPAELKKIHPLGKAPLLTTARGRVVAESNVIAKYLIDEYDKAGTFQGDGGKNDLIHDEELCSFAASSMTPIMTIDLVFQLITARSPFFIRPLFSATYRQLRNMFLGPEIAKQFSYISDQLGEQDYFMGTSPGRADFSLSWPVDFCVRMKIIVLEDYPKLRAWNDRCKAREGWKSSMKKGNGYLGPKMSIDFADDP